MDEDSICRRLHNQMERLGCDQMCHLRGYVMLEHDPHYRVHTYTAAKQPKDEHRTMTPAHSRRKASERGRDRRSLESKQARRCIRRSAPSGKHGIINVPVTRIRHVVSNHLRLLDRIETARGRTKNYRGHRAGSSSRTLSALLPTFVHAARARSHQRVVLDPVA